MKPKITINKKALEKEMLKQSNAIKKQLLPQLKQKIAHLSEVEIIDIHLEGLILKKIHYEGPEDQIALAQEILFPKTEV